MGETMDLFDQASINPAHIRRLRALAWIDRAPHEFRPDFKAWLVDNWQLFEEFERLALRIAQHRKHYGARSIVEKMRYDTTIAEKDRAFKINGNFVPPMARLFAMMNPDHEQLFEFREQKRAA